MPSCDSCHPDEPMVYNGIVEEHVCQTCHYAILQLYQTMQHFVLEHLGVVENGQETTLFSAQFWDDMSSVSEHRCVSTTDCASSCKTSESQCS